ncbi:MAG: C40 family peptidase [Actinomycetota bacterium]|nr:C40 family peptidase [Actinomycetota bacterium]
MGFGKQRHTTVKRVGTSAVGAVVAAALVVVAPAAPADAHTRDKVRRQRAHVRERGKSQIGANYSYGGTTPRGFDCSGYTRWTFQEHGANLPHSSIDQFELAKRRGYRRIWKKSRLRVGDLVFHKTTSARVGHAGIYIGRGKFISSTSSDGVRVRSLYDPYYWGPRFVGGTRVPSLIKN